MSVSLGLKYRDLPGIYVIVPYVPGRETECKLSDFEMRLDRATIEQLDRWRASQPTLPSRAEAVRRLVHDGLGASSDDEMRPTPTEKLILSMLCDLARDRNDTERIDPDFVQYAIGGGRYWAFRRRYPDIFDGRPDSPELVSEVEEILYMWNVIEHHYDHLGESDKARVASEAAPYGTDVKFTGFYPNEESSHKSIAEFSYRVHRRLSPI